MNSTIFSPFQAWNAALLITLVVPFPGRPADNSQQSVQITFSGVYNGTHPWSDLTVVHRPMPFDYQPLMAPSPHTNPIDGGDLHTRITWDGACVSNHGYNSRVFDHTVDYVDSTRKSGGGVLFGTSPFAMTFSRPVEIPSLFWSFYIHTTKTGTISVYRLADDLLPLKTVKLPYPDAHGYVWRQLTAFAGLNIQKIAFDPGDETHATGLNIDDMTVETGK